MHKVKCQSKLYAYNFSIICRKAGDHPLADDFGLRIGIEGESQFKNALRDINQTFKVLGSEMALVTSQFDKNDKSVNSLTSHKC